MRGALVEYGYFDANIEKRQTPFFFRVPVCYIFGEFRTFTLNLAGPSFNQREWGKKLTHSDGSGEARMYSTSILMTLIYSLRIDVVSDFEMRNDTILRGKEMLIS